MLEWHIGDVEITQIVEMEGGPLIHESLSQATKESITSVPWLSPHFAQKNGSLKALVQTFLVKSQKKLILIDTGNGNGKKRPHCPTWGNLNTDYLQRFSELGIKPESIDYVLNTHLHFDHIGWNTYRKDNAWVPTFPNATYLFVKEEYDYWKGNPEKEMEDDKLGFADSIEPIVGAGLAKLVPSDFKLDEHISLIPTPGHTPGHISVKIQANDKTAIISGDIIHHPIQLAYPDWTTGFDSLEDAATQSKLELLEDLADTKTLFIGTHFANPVAGYIVRDNGAFKLNTD